MANLQDLQAQLASLEEQRADLYGQSSVDQTAVAAINEQIKEVQALIAAAEQEQQVKAQVEEKVAEAQAQVSSSFESITVGDQVVTLGELAANEFARQILQIYILQEVTSRTEQAEREKALLTAQLKESEERREKSSADYDLLVEQMSEQRKQSAAQVAQLQLALDDMTARRDAAGTEIEELKAEVARLDSQVTDLRTEIAIGAKAAVNVVTNMDNDKIKELMKKLNDSKPAIYDVQPVDARRSKYTAKLATSDEPVEFGYLEKGKYREVTAEEAAEIAGRFRAEQEASAAAEAEQAPATETISDTNDDTTVPVGGGLTPPQIPAQVPPFQTNDAEAHDSVGGESPDTALETATRSVEERLAALEQRVTELEQGKVGAAA